MPGVLLHNPNAVVDVLGSQDNKVEIFRKEERSIGKLYDLVDIIRKLLHGQGEETSSSFVQ